ncbi:MAG: DEAD/DEAH box helicase family protein [Nanoarchaeota archaeon]|nr:DEAD/DEAH box helicase family protein [Nanoarchaeota archaeon]
MSNIISSKIQPRPYQSSIINNSYDKNTFVVLPTGLGKTIIAQELLVYYGNKFPNKKILFLAPTRPLVEQQQISIQNTLEGINENDFITLTGQVSPSKREAIYQEKKFIFSTPQLIENDIINGILNPNEITLCIFDEAHRASGNYAYTFIATALKDTSKILALSASPGTNKEEIMTTFTNLYIEHIEVKTYEDKEIKEFVSKTRLLPVEVELSSEIIAVITLLKTAYNKRLEFLKELGYFQGKSISMIYKKDLLQLTAELRTTIATGETDENMWKGISMCASIMKLSYAIELIESQDFGATHSYLVNIFKDANSTKAAQDLTLDLHIKEAFEILAYYIKGGVVHPKRLKLVELISQVFQKQQDSKIIVFNQYRETAQAIVSELEQFNEFKPTIFVGQAKKGEMKMSQKEQKQVLQQFRDGEFNILVSTSVGEEGLDIPKVDTVIFYEPIPSAIRAIQRIGRTGRFDKGSAFVLLTKGTRDIATRHIANAKEKRMYRVLKDVQEEFKRIYESSNPLIQNSSPKHLGLNQYMDKNSNSTTSNEKIEASTQFTPTIYVDVRENNDLLKELYYNPDLQVVAKQLDVGDIVISEQCAIERKSKKDFVNSILDKRLLPQLLSLAKNYKRPILILEGDESIYAQRNVDDNLIRGVLCAISVDLRIPILYTQNLKDTVKMIITLTKRANKDKKEHSLHTNKSSISTNEELEKVISMIPTINISLSKEILKNFSTIEQLVYASKEDLEKIDGIGAKRADKIYTFLREEYKLE